MGIIGENMECKLTINNGDEKLGKLSIFARIYNQNRKIGHTRYIQGIYKVYTEDLVYTRYVLFFFVNK